jgi:hypothetical protein
MTSSRSLHHYLGVTYFVHPIPLSAVVLMVLNDHYFKAHFSSWWTGKLSDFMGVFFFPLFLSAVWNLTCNVGGAKTFHWLTRRQLLGTIFLTDLLLIGVKLSPSIRSGYLALMSAIGVPSQVTADPGDLLALVVNPLTYAFGRRYFD